MPRPVVVVLWSVFVGCAKVVAVLLGLAVTWNLTLGRNWSGVTETAEQAVMWSDLRNLPRAQEMALGSDSAWSAVASYSHVSMQCAIFVGSIKPPLPGGEEGYPVCQESP